MTAARNLVAVPHPIDDHMAAAIIGVHPVVGPEDIAAGVQPMRVTEAVERWERWCLQLYRAQKASRTVEAVGEVRRHARWPWAQVRLQALAERGGAPVAVLLDAGTSLDLTPMQVARACWLLDVTGLEAVDVAVLVQHEGGWPELVVHQRTRADLLEAADVEDLFKRVMRWRWAHLLEGAGVAAPIAEDLVEKARACTGPPRRGTEDEDALIAELRAARDAEAAAKRTRQAVEARIVEAANGSRYVRGRRMTARVGVGPSRLDLDHDLVKRLAKRRGPDVAKDLGRGEPRELVDVAFKHGIEVAEEAAECFVRVAPESVVTLFPTGYER